MCIDICELCIGTRDASISIRGGIFRSSNAASIVTSNCKISSNLISYTYLSVYDLILQDFSLSIVNSCLSPFTRTEADHVGIEKC